MLKDEEINRIKEEIIAKYGKKGNNKILCRNLTHPCIMRTGKNKNECLNPRNGPEIFLMPDRFNSKECKYSIEVQDGLIWC